MRSIYLMFASALVLTGCKSREPERVNKEGKVNPNCAYTRNELNPVGKPILMVEEALFISVLNEDSATQSKSFKNDLFKGYLSCVREDTVMGVYLNFKIYSADAWKDYGMLRKDNKISFILASGKAVTVPFKETFSGNTNLTSDVTEYKTVANISEEDAEVLKSSGLQRVNISWTKREEEYKVVNPGIFINQIPCIE